MNIYVLMGYFLSTTHARSSHGIPVLVGPDGTAYGADDILPEPAGSHRFKPAADMVRRWLHLTGHTDDDVKLGTLFLQPGPGGPADEICE